MLWQPNDFEKKLLNHKMIFVEGGSFIMGGQRPISYHGNTPKHKVTLSSFYLGKYPVTQAIWQTVMESNPSFFLGGNYPVDSASWEEVKIFIQRLNVLASDKNEMEFQYRLPSEAEWEFASFGGKLMKSYQFSGSNKLKEVGWYQYNSHWETKPVGLKFPNDLGLYDMSGNVWEWCEDTFDEKWYLKCHEMARKGVEVLDPVCQSSSLFKVRRGGSWSDEVYQTENTFRHRIRQDTKYQFLGFRLAMSSNL